MALFTSGIAANQDAFYQAQRAHMLLNGWTEHDIISDVVDNRNIVFKGTATDATTGNAPLLQIIWNGTQFYTLAHADWDVGTNIGAFTTGSTTASNTFVAAVPFSYWIRVNGSAVAVSTQVSTTYYFNYFGFLRGGKPASTNGTTKLSAGILAGVSSLPVSSSMVGKLRVGEKIMLIDQSHSSVAGTWQNSEIVTVSSIAAGSIGILAPTVNAYAINSFVGFDPSPNFTSDFVISAPGNTPYGTTAMNGVYYSATSTNQRFTLTAHTLGNTSANNPDNNGEYSSGYWELYSSSTTGGKGTRGILHHYLSPVCGTMSPGDIYDEGAGIVDSIILRADLSSGIAMMRG